MRVEASRKVWENEILPNWDTVKNTKRVRELWVDGLPKIVRGRAWSLACGNECVVTRELFEIMAERGRNLRNLLKDHLQIERQIFDAVNNATVSNLHQITVENEDNCPEKTKELIDSLNKTRDDSRKYLSLLIEIKPDENNPERRSDTIKSKDKSLLVLDVDVPRTFPHLGGIFQAGGQYHEKLLQVLQAFAVTRPDIGYV